MAEDLVISDTVICCSPCKNWYRENLPDYRHDRVSQPTGHQKFYKCKFGLIIVS